MALTKFNTDVSNHQGLSDRPNANEGMTPAALKILYDKAANDIKIFLNNTMTAEIDSVFTALKGAGWTSENLKGLKDALDDHKDSSDHDERYFTEEELNNGALDNRYDGRHYKKAEMNSTTDNDSGADKIGVSSITTLSGTTVQDVLEAIKARFDNIGTTNANVEVSNAHFGADGRTHDDIGKRFDGLDSSLADNIQQISDITIHDTGIYVSILEYGGKPNDSSFDNTTALQNAINYLESIGGGVVKIPFGKWYFKGTITMPQYCSIQGVPTVARSESLGSILVHNPSISTPFFQFKSYAYYCYGNMFKDLTIMGNGATGTVIDANKTAHMIMDNVSILYGGISLKITGGMLNTFKNVTMTYYREFGLLIVKSSLTTTQRFYDCYIGQTTFSNTSIPLKIETRAVTDCAFYSLTLESTNQGAWINMQNNVNFHNVYVENVGANQAISVFNIGILEEGEVAPTGWYFKGITHFTGGNIQGSSFDNTTAGKNLFNVDCVDIVTVKNIRYVSYNKTLVYNVSNITYKICFENTYGMGVSNDLNTIADTKVKIVDCGISTGAIYSYTDDSVFRANDTIFQSRGSVYGTENLNDIKFRKSGTWFYYSNGTTANNFPYANANGMLIVYYHPVGTTDGFISQAFRGTDNSLWHRFSGNRGVSWTAWKQQTT